MPALKLLTWNLWFGEFARRRRLEAVLGIVRRHAPDVVAFQEVVPDTLQQLRAAPWIAADYHLTDSAGETFGAHYGTILMSRMPPTEVHVMPLRSEMGRRLVAIDVPVGGTLLRVGGIHLESEYTRPRRIEQLRRILPFLAAADAAVLMGDMNFTDGDPEEAEFPSHLQDVWRSLHPEDPGITRDSTSNTMAGRHDNTPQRRRLDRIFLQAGTTGWQPRSIAIIGAAPIEDDPTVFPSDHYGLVAELELA